MSLPLSTIRQGQGGQALMVLLPGAYMRAEDFVTAGFFRRAAEAASGLDLIAVDIGRDDLSGSTALPALQAEIIAPARAAGYRQIWLGGISLGGLLALCYAADHPDAIDGLCLLAPYPGSRLTTNAIARAGGLAAWQPTPEQTSDPEFRAWRWLQAPPAGLPVFIGYGSDDRFAEGMRQIAACFPPSASLAIAGGHEWPVWQTLWDHFLMHHAADR